MTGSTQNGRFFQPVQKDGLQSGTQSAPHQVRHRLSDRVVTCERVLKTRSNINSCRAVSRAVRPQHVAWRSGETALVPLCFFHRGSPQTLLETNLHKKTVSIIIMIIWLNMLLFVIRSTHLWDHWAHRPSSVHLFVRWSKKGTGTF